MKLPEKPVGWEHIFIDRKKEILKITEDKRLLSNIFDYNKRYFYWDDLKYRIKNRTEQEAVWTIMKLFRSERYETIPFRPMLIRYINLPEIIKSMHNFDRYLAGNIEVHSQNLGLEKNYIISSLMEEAIASSMIEGAVTTRKAAKEMLRQKRKPANRSEQMVLNGYETMQMILKRKEKELTPEFLLEIQEMITKDTLEDEEDSGKYRDNNGVIVGHSTQEDIIYHTPPDYRKISDLIKELCDFANKDEIEFIHPIIKGIALHFLIGYIHPFNDGNGRTARSIFYWYMLSRGYWLFEYMALSRRILRSKREYGLAYLYTEYDEMDLTYFIKYNINAIEDTLQDLLNYIKIKQKEQVDLQKSVTGIHDLNHRQVSVLTAMIKEQEKYFTIQEISVAYRIVYQTARTDLLLLAKKGLVELKKVSKRFLFKYKPGINNI